MKNRKIIEYFTQKTESNFIVEINNTFIKDSVKVIKKETEVEVDFVELSSNIIRLKELVDLNEILTISYEILVTDFNEDIDVLKEIRDLKEKVKSLEKSQELLLKAVQERVPESTFKQWILLMEKSFGKPLISENHLMGIAGQSLPVLKLGLKT